eukprot:CAMPEP_0194282124 /NCGR_PEP_ID=MMETSP0169-20130528/22442_1 /TAXON_ID=218684 /ORGANISM="Corethron pennatum, Strain L29A3" /LENGTH=118 /DNA_ID=CAMNT_0039027365 /DNA_START=97 /DNA_END=450 /DNA_ORIENTATION=+
MAHRPPPPLCPHSRRRAAVRAVVSCWKHQTYFMCAAASPVDSGIESLPAPASLDVSGLAPVLLDGRADLLASYLYDGARDDDDDGPARDDGADGTVDAVPYGSISVAEFRRRYAAANR